MYVCPDCSRLGTPIKETSSRPVQPAGATRTRAPNPNKDALANRELELADDYHVRIQRARERKALSREDLGRMINEKVSTIAHLETKQLHPPDSLVRKLEKALEITLMERVEDVRATSAASSTGMTLADFIVKKKR